MHFSQARKKYNPRATIKIQGHTTVPRPSLCVLGIYFDPKLNLGAHIKQVQLKASTQMQSISRLTQSICGPTFHWAKLIYSSIVRLALTYGSPIWAQTGQSGKIPERLIKLLRSIQRKSLKVVTDAYKSTSGKVLEHESSTLTIEIYLRQRRLQYLGLSMNQLVHRAIVAARRNIKLPSRGRVLNHIQRRHWWGRMEKKIRKNYDQKWPKRHDEGGSIPREGGFLVKNNPEPMLWTTRSSRP